MQISNAYSEAAQSASYRASPRHDAGPAENASATRSAPPVDVTTGKADKTSASNAIFQKYDLTNISPRDVDAMAKELRDSGFDDVGFILGLETRGEKWRSHMMQSLNDAGYEFDPSYDPTARTDVIAGLKEQVQTSQRFGDPTEFLSEQLSKMERLNAQAHPQTATSGPSPEMAQTLMLFQAQRIWVE
ncbi:hypothetical protein EDD53_0821 [Pacificibacter maritimus]|uniref:Uncharacterized protein n=1 Tax=Pacificibacter maritimus TaxID=762213 RepID=A0A3N4USL8_9RHOB|nr:hypothetical protein [Pacificibacter maritimus]RPE71695.1 hypothetical protein EDD53_0821 [Pacificibacter maritimus]